MYTTYLKLHAAQIKRNREPLPGDRAEVKFYSFAADEHFNLPAVDNLLGQTNATEMRPHLKAAIESMVGSMMWESPLVEGIRRGHRFDLGDTGKVVFRHQGEKPPEQIDWLLTAIEIDEDIRNLGTRVDEILTDETVDQMSSAIIALAGVATGPTSAAAIGLSKIFLGALTDFMKKNKNDQVGVVNQSFIRALDFADGHRKVDMNPDYSGNMWYTYSITTIES